MKNRRLKGRKLFYLMTVFALFFSFVAYVSAIGIAPGQRSFIYAGEQIEYNVRITIDGNSNIKEYLLEVTGELSEYVELSRDKIIFADGQTDEIVVVKINLTDNKSIVPGEHSSRIVVKQMEGSNDGVVAYVGVASKIDIVVPGEGAYIEAQIFVPNFVKEKENSFSIDTINKGVLRAENCLAVIEIKTAMNSEVATIVSQRFFVDGARTERIYVPWIPEVSSGKYYAHTEIICDGITAESSAEFMIGSPEVKVIGFQSDSFFLGDINKFDLVLGSEWGDPISGVFANVDLEKDGIKVFSTATPTVEMEPNGKARIPVYLDTEGMAPGKYSLYIMLHYMGKDLGEVYNVQMGPQDIKIDKLTGMITGPASGSVGQQGSSGDGSNGLLIIAIVVIVTVNVALILKLYRKK